VIWRRTILVLFLAHLALVVVRIPRSVVGKRIDEVSRYREVGAARYHLEDSGYGGAEWVEWIVDNVPADAVVLYRGDQKGAFEFVPSLLYPRLVWSAGAVSDEARTLAGRPIARGEVPGKGVGTLVLVGLGDRIGLEVR
jgi:hypothetical protein